MSSSQSIIERARARRERQERADHELHQSSTPGPDASSMRSSSPPPSEFAEPSNLFAPILPRNTSHNTPALMVIMKATGERASKTRKLNDAAQADFAHFLETSHPLEREALTHLTLLEVRSLLQDNAQTSQQSWEPSRELLKTMKKTIRALLLMPNLQYYGGSLSATIVEAMHKSGVPGLPEDDALIKEHSSHPLLVDKNTIKSALKQSMTVKNKAKRNIAFVTAKNIKSFGVPVLPTLSLYYRFAHIRAELAKDHGNEVFWSEVDNVLEDYRKEGAAEFVICLEEGFRDDVAKYGDPAKTEFKLAPNTITANAPKWLKSVHELAPKVHRLDTMLTSRKRRHVVDSDEEEEPHEPSLSGEGGGGNSGNGVNSGDDSGNGGNGGDGGAA